MKRTLLLMIIVALTGISCEEVININLNDSSPELVAEGIIEIHSPCTVSLSYTSNYFDTLSAIPEEDAVITISDSEERSEVLDHLGNGIYRGNIIHGLPGHTYTLSISAGNNEYQARSLLYSYPKLINLEYEKLYIPHYTENTIYSVKCIIVDDSYNENFYLFRYYRNGEMINDYFSTYSDRFLVEDTVVYTDFRLDFYKGDTVKVELFAIDEGVYNYFNLVNDVLFSSMRSSTPFNPASNFSNGLLGYFMAASSDRETIIIN